MILVIAKENDHRLRSLILAHDILQAMMAYCLRLDRSATIWTTLARNVSLVWLNTVAGSLSNTKASLETLKVEIGVLTFFSDNSYS